MQSQPKLINTIFEVPLLFPSGPECGNPEFHFRAVAMIEELLVADNRAFPIQMFRLLHDPMSATAIAATPPCMLDSWSSDFLSQHKEDLTSELALHKLRQIAMSAPTDIASVETAHSRVRRRLLAASHSTNRQNQTACNADWVIAEARRRDQDLLRQDGRRRYGGKVRARRAAVKAKAKSRKKATRVCKSKSGGRCRAFLSKNLGKGRSMAELHREFKKLSQAEIEAMDLNTIADGMKKAGKARGPQTKVCIPN